jgi:amino acid transporter
MSVNIKKPIFPNAPPMDRDEAKKLAKRAIIFAFSYGLIRLKKSSIVDDKYLIGMLTAPSVLMILLANIFSESFWPQFAVFLYLIGGVIILLKIHKEKDPEEAMGFLSIKNNFIMIISIATFIALTFGGIFYSHYILVRDVNKMIANAESADQTTAYVDSMNFGFPQESVIANYAPDSPLLKDYDRCSKNTSVLMRLVKKELSSEKTIRDYSKTVTAWPIPLGYIVYNGDYPSGTYTYAFAFDKSFDDEHYKLKDLIIVLPENESKRKDRIIQHLTLINSLCRDQ